MSNQLLTQFDLHHRLYNNVLESFTDKETNRRLYDDDNINHVNYLTGHLLNLQNPEGNSGLFSIIILRIISVRLAFCGVDLGKLR